MACVALAVCEASLAFAALRYASQGMCPTFADGTTCAPLIRPRLAALGPFTVSQLAMVGATLTVGLCFLALFEKMNARLAKLSAVVLAVGAGFALALQALPLQVSGTLCLLCAGIAAASVLVAFGFGHALQVDKKLSAAAFGIALLVALPLTVWRASVLNTEDAARRAAVAEVGGETGLQLVLVTRDGCPYCVAFEVDVLGDPAVLEVLSRTRGVKFVTPRSPEANALKDVKGAPTLIAVGSDGEERGRIEGLKPADVVEAWLRKRVPG